MISEVFTSLIGSVTVKQLSVPHSCAPRYTVSHHGGACQPHEHDEAQHQNPHPVSPEPGPDPGLRLPPTAAVLRGAGALPQARAQRWALAARKRRGRSRSLCHVLLWLQLDF